VWDSILVVELLSTRLCWTGALQSSLAILEVAWFVTGQTRTCATTPDLSSLALRPAPLLLFSGL
jgi:hypothetical protein